MKQFESDVRLLAELDAEIKSVETAAYPPQIAADLLSAIMPGAGKLMPTAQKASQRKLELLRSVRQRLGELIAKEHDE